MTWFFRRLAGFVSVVLLVVITLGSAHGAQPRHFAETGHNLLDPMASYWDAHGGLPVFGYPISEAFSETNRDTGTAFPTQYFERNRFEHHPENAAPYHILLGLLGKEALAAQGRDWQTFPKADPAAAHYVPETGHAITHTPFWQYFSTHGLEFDGRRGYSYAESLALFGQPLSEPQLETNASGDTVLTQWFERVRFEDHGAKGVLLGLLGSELTAGRRSEAAFVPTVAQDEIHAAGMQLFGIFNQRRVAEAGKPAVGYRADLQAEADRIAREWTEVRQAGGDGRAVLQAGNQRLAVLGGLPTSVYGQTDAPLTAQCKGVDPVQPIRSAYSPYVAGLDFATLTIGVYGPYDGSCGRSMSVVYIISY
ncbi:MAG TPA: hypothetical protein VGE07_16735 [Herpetosiphonaceae bacterium]